MNGAARFGIPRRTRLVSSARPAAALVLGVVLLAAVGPARAQDVGGVLYEDRDADGIRDAGEPPIEGLGVRIYGQSDASGAVDQTAASAADGRFDFSPGDGCYLLAPADPPGWRLGPTRFDTVTQGTAGYVAPVGLLRLAKLDQGIANLEAGTLRYSALGDSIATNFNFCEFGNFFGSFNYSEDFRDRLRCVAPGASVTIDEYAVKGEHTDDLLLDDGSDNNVFRILALEPELVSLSMVGNDLLDVDAASMTQEQINVAVEELLDSWQNLQEALSSMLAGVPGLDVTLNSLYDNLAEDCYLGTQTTPFHREWMAVLNGILRELAWGQIRRVSVNEVSAEFGLEDLNGSCSGFGEQICSASSDGIHPIQDGYDVIREKLWEASGGLSLGSRDAAGRTSFPDADFGYLRLVRRVHPTSWEARDGAEVTDPEAALTGDDAGAAASIRLGLGSEEFRVSGFPDWLDEIEVVKAVAGVRYRTTGTFQDDLYRIEASPTGVFRAPPGHDYSPTDWNFFTPIVGGGGPNAPAVKPDYPGARLLVTPQVASDREVSATLTKNPVLDAGAGTYRWPPIDHQDLSTTAMRVAAAPVGTTAGPDGRIEVDELWIDLYGWEKERPPEVATVLVEALPDGSLSVTFEPLAGAERYNIYFGRAETIRAGAYDHGASAPAGPLCDAATAGAPGGRLEIVVPAAQVPPGSVYLAVTAHVDGVESPAGLASSGSEHDRSQSTCR